MTATEESREGEAYATGARDAAYTQDTRWILALHEVLDDPKVIGAVIDEAIGSEAAQRRSARVGEAPSTGPDGDPAADTISWLLDVLDMYDGRLAQIDGNELVYTDIHGRGKERAREVLEWLRRTKEAEAKGLARATEEIEKVLDYTDLLPSTREPLKRALATIRRHLTTPESEDPAQTEGTGARVERRG